MGLPKIQHPVFDLTLPSTKKKIQFRPFLVKEEKILLMAQQSDNSADIMKAVKQVINNCIVTEGVEVDDFTTFDIEYFFIKLRAKSVNNIVSLTYRDLEDEQEYTFEVDLDEIEVQTSKEHTNDIKLTDEMGIILRYPRMDIADKLTAMKSETDIFFEMLKYSIEKVYDADSVYILSDFSKQEVEEFISSIDVGSFQKIQQFFETMPHIDHVLKYTNKLGKEKTIHLRNMNDFFTLG